MELLLFALFLVVIGLCLIIWPRTRSKKARLQDDDHLHRWAKQSKLAQLAADCKKNPSLTKKCVKGPDGELTPIGRLLWTYGHLVNLSPTEVAPFRPQDADEEE